MIIRQFRDHRSSNYVPANSSSHYYASYDPWWGASDHVQRYNDKPSTVAYAFGGCITTGEATAYGALSAFNPRSFSLSPSLTLLSLSPPPHPLGFRSRLKNPICKRPPTGAARSMRGCKHVVSRELNSPSCLALVMFVHLWNFLAIARACRNVSPISLEIHLSNRLSVIVERIVDTQAS